jgi:hypothetical protein
VDDESCLGIGILFSASQIRAEWHEVLNLLKCIWEDAER